MSEKRYEQLKRKHVAIESIGGAECLYVEKSVGGRRFGAPGLVLGVKPYDALMWRRMADYLDTTFDGMKAAGR